MAFLWSNPTPEVGKTLPELQSQFKVESPNIGPLIGAILEQRARADKQRREDMNSLIQGAASVAGGVVQGQQHAGQEDTARAAQYFSQNPQAYQDYVQSGQIPAGVTQGSDIDQIMLQKMMSGQGAPSFYTDPTTGASVYRWPGGKGGGQIHTTDPNSVMNQVHENTLAQAKEKDIQAQIAAELGSTGLKGGDLANASFASKTPVPDPRTWYQKLYQNAPEQPTVDPADVTAHPENYTTTVTATDKTGLPRKVPLDTSSYLKAKDYFDQAQKLRTATGGTGSRGGVEGLRAEAEQAIQEGRDEAAVRAQFKQMTGQDL